ncbi:helix-turn-helix transcriptional regulator [Photobacterium indicum]|uniref:helix-turn-helix transcriptional regulator n=1 Tax=Photobacterium indicum TaxID=81447 RepID=UPI003D0EAE4E
MFKNLPPRIKFLSVHDLLPIFGSRSSVDKMRVEKLLPTPVNPYGRRIVWPEHEIELISRFIAAGLSKDEMRAKVVEITEARKNLLK